MPQGLNLIGQKFGKLTVIAMGHGPSGRIWYCLCDCGKKKEKPLTAYELKQGKRNHCGCVKPNSGMRTHGQSETKLYKVWSSMKHRCSNPNDPAYCNYGARGITVCDEWQTFEPFHTWAMANGYREGLTIERQGNNKGYSPENCIWIPKPEQSNNTRRCRMITYRGETHNIKDWARKLGIPYARLQSRLKHGWEIEEALTLPEIPASLRHANSDEARMIREVQQATGIPCRAAAD